MYCEYALQQAKNTEGQKLWKKHLYIIYDVKIMSNI